MKSVRDIAAMREYIEAYFQGEIRAGTAFAAVGAGALVASLLLWRGRSELRGMLYPLTLFGLIQVGVGAGLVFGTSRQVAALMEQLERSPAAFRDSELSRMQGVQRSFRIIEAAEIVLLLGGLGLAAGMRSNRLWSAVGMGLVAQMSVMLVFDLVSERRARVYTEQLEAFEPTTIGV